MDIQHSISTVQSSQSQRNFHREGLGLPEGWESFKCTKANIENAWEKFNQFPILFDDSDRGDKEIFVKNLLDPNSVVLATGDYGLVRISQILIGRDAQVHLTFWDKRFKGRDKECEQVLRWLFLSLRLHRITIQIPEIAYATASFTKSLGFVQEGTIRDAWRYNGKFLNILIFGILRDEVLGEEE